MAIKRVVSTEFWTDPKVVEMFSPEDKLFFLYLMTNPHTTQLGVYQISKKVMAFEIGYSIDAVSVLIDRFENKYHLIKYSPSTSEIAIRNYLKHSIVKGGKPVEDLLAKEIDEVKDTSLLGYIHDSLADIKDLNVSVCKILPLLKENDNDNDNDNDDSYHESYHESSKPKKHRHGEYKHVLLSDSELEKLKAKYGETDTAEYIKFLDEYIERKGYKAKSHYLCIGKWVVDAVAEEKAKKKSKAANQLDQAYGMMAQWAEE